jgi:exonuclease VII small subunit
MAGGHDDFAGWRVGIKYRVSTLEVTVQTEAWMRAQMDQHMSDLKVRLGVQHRILGALRETQSEHTQRLTRLEDGQRRLEAGQFRLEASTARLEAGQAKLEASTARLEAGQARLEATTAKLEAKATKLEGRMVKLEGGMETVLAGVETIIRRLDRDSES